MPPEDHDLSYFRGAFISQPLMLAGINGFLISTLYRLDQQLAAQKSNAIALAAGNGEATEEEELALLEPLPEMKGTKGPSGARVPVPSTNALVRKHFVAHHLGLFTSVTYAKLATFLTLATLASFAVLGNLCAADAADAADKSSVSPVIGVDPPDRS